MYITLPIVRVRDLGKLCFQKAYEVQKSCFRELLSRVKSSDYPSLGATLLLVEHSPVYTVGIRRNLYDENEENRLKSIGADFVKTDRGGLITFHGPGQLVAYPILYLGSFNAKRSIKWYVQKLENTVIDMCREFDIKAGTTADTGVWVENRKIAAIGIHCSRYITTHGVAINCDIDLTWFEHITPCGIPNKEVTSLSQELKRPVTVEDAKPVFLSSFQKLFHCQLSYND